MANSVVMMRRRRVKSASIGLAPVRVFNAVRSTLNCRCGRWRLIPSQGL